MASERILIVDDEEGMRRLLGRVLSREGYETTTVASGAEALQHVARERFDLVVTDIKMPEMDGLELLAELKEYEPSLPIIVMTAYGTVENAVQDGDHRVAPIDVVGVPRRQINDDSADGGLTQQVAAHRFGR